MWCFLQNSRTSAPDDFTTVEWYIVPTGAGEAGPGQVKIVVQGVGGSILPSVYTYPSNPGWDRR